MGLRGPACVLRDHAWILRDHAWLRRSGGASFYLDTGRKALINPAHQVVLSPWRGQIGRVVSLVVIGLHVLVVQV